MKASRVLTDEEKAALTPDQIQRSDLECRLRALPRWAQDYIARLTRERDRAIRQHADFLADQPDGPFYTTHMSPTRATPIERRHDAMVVGCRIGNIRVEMRPHESYRPPGITIIFNDDRGCGRLAVMTESNNCIRIVEVSP